MKLVLSLFFNLETPKLQKGWSQSSKILCESSLRKGLNYIKNFGRIGQAIRHLIGRQLSSLAIYFSKTIRVRRPKFYGHEHRVRIFIVYKFSKNRITKSGEKGNLFYLRIQLNQENQVVKFYLLIIYNFDS